MAPLNQLLQKDIEWKWTRECQRSFDLAKETLVSSEVLTHYDPSLPVRMAGDASAYGICAVIAHVLPDGSKRLLPLPPALCPVVRKIMPKLRRRLCLSFLELRDSFIDAVHHNYRPQTTHSYTGSQEGDTPTGSCKVTEVVLDSI